MPKYFHYISYLQYLLYLFGLYFVFIESMIRMFSAENYVSELGFGITLIGIGYGIGSLGNIDILSKKDREILDSPIQFKKHTKSLFLGTVVLLLISLIFISINIVNPQNPIAQQYSNLGYGCISFALGMFFELKQMYEKRLIYNQQNEIE